MSDEKDIIKQRVTLLKTTMKMLQTVGLFQYLISFTNNNKKAMSVVDFKSRVIKKTVVFDGKQASSDIRIAGCDKLFDLLNQNFKNYKSVKLVTVSNNVLNFEINPTNENFVKVTGSINVETKVFKMEGTEETIKF